MARRLYGPRLEGMLGPARAREDPIEQRHEDIARSLQVVFERAVVHVLHDLWQRTRSPRLCVVGGCFMNSVLNGKILDQTPFEELFVQPAGGDAGTALGAAFSAGSGERGTMEHAYLGTAHGRPEIDRALEALPASGGDYEVTSLPDGELAQLTAALLADGDVIGWFRGRMEFGARALGARSILADPRRPDMADRLNSTVKARESFRPFGASVLESELSEYFDGAAPDPFMVQVHSVRPAMRSAIPAVTHVDGSSRPHTVTAAANAVYHDVIRAFRRPDGRPDGPQHELQPRRADSRVAAAGPRVLHERRPGRARAGGHPGPPADCRLERDVPVLALRRRRRAWSRSVSSAVISRGRVSWGTITSSM